MGRLDSIVSCSRLYSLEKENPCQFALEKMRETEAEKEERACGCLSSLCLPGREEQVGMHSTDVPRPCSSDVGPLPVHLTACSLRSGKAQALESGGCESKCQLWFFLADGTMEGNLEPLIKWDKITSLIKRQIAGLGLF